MAEDSTGVSGGKVSPLYRAGDVIIFKYEGNVRAEVTGHQVIDGRVWLEARAADLTFLVPAHIVVGAEPKEVR
jgi:hypothetical protein